ncbi:MAG: 3D domain-containing protein [Aurantibacter sp.]
MKRIQGAYLRLTIFVFFILSCKGQDQYIWKPLEVKVSAFNSVASQTDGRPNLAAWGDTLKPGMKCIAVSRDLISLGLGHNTKIRIEGLPDIYLVKDKMNARYRNRIDIYMGTDVKKAKQWGQKRLKIEYAMAREKPSGKPKSN